MSEQSRERIERLLARFDTDTRIPEAFTAEKLIDLALIIFETANVINPATPVQTVLGVALTQYLSERQP